MMSSVTPALSGDIKTGQNAFFTPPVSAMTCTTRNPAGTSGSISRAWGLVGRGRVRGAGGRAVRGRSEESATLRAGFLWHKVTRENRRLGIRAEVTSFVPAGDDRVELMRVRITNTGTQRLAFTPTAAIPVYGRSADNVRDHRHVTSLLKGIRTERPAWTFSPR